MRPPPEPKPPAHDVAQQGTGIHSKDLVHRQGAPEASQRLHGVRERPWAGRQEGRVDGASGNAGDNGEGKIRTVPDEATKEPHLIGRPRPTAVQDDG